MCYLQNGKGVVTLANAKGNGFTLKPLLLLWFLKVFFLPLGRGQNTNGFAFQVDACFLTKAQRPHKIMHHIDAHFPR